MYPKVWCFIHFIKSPITVIIRKLVIRSKRDPIACSTALYYDTSERLINNTKRMCVGFINFFNFLSNYQRKHFNTYCTKLFKQYRNTLNIHFFSILCEIVGLSRLGLSRRGLSRRRTIEPSDYPYAIDPNTFSTLILFFGWLIDRWFFTLLRIFH